MSDPEVCDKALDVMAHEDGVLLIGPDGQCFAVTVRAAEESAARLLAAVATEKSRQRAASRGVVNGG